MKRLKTAKGRKVSSTRWLERQLNDPYVKRAKAENYRSRAAYKLLELDERFGLLKGVKAVVDLGIAPGGWSQVVRRKAPQAKVVGIDLLPTDPIDGVDDPADGLHGRGRARPAARRRSAGPPTSSCRTWRRTPSAIQQTDHLRTMALVEAGLEFAREVLRPGGAYVAKVLAGGADNELVAELKRHFTTVKHAKPPASRKDSSEWYVVAQGFKGSEDWVTEQQDRNSFLSRLGPGLITGAADDDPSGIGTHSQVGAQFGYASVVDVRPQLPAAGRNPERRRRDRPGHRPGHRRQPAPALSASRCCGSAVRPAARRQRDQPRRRPRARWARRCSC